jgi:hypothetical protein
MRKWVIYEAAFLLIVSANGYPETLRAGPANYKLEAESSFRIEINKPDLGNDSAPPPASLGGNTGVDPLIRSFVADVYANQNAPETGNIDFFQLPYNDESDNNDIQPGNSPPGLLAAVPPLLGLLVFGSNTGGSSDPSVTISPLPSTMILFGTGLIGFIGLRKRFRK